MNYVPLQLDESTFESIDHKKIKNKVGEGLNHSVYAYDVSRVIKLPKKTGGLRYSNSQLLQADLNLIHQYFPHLAVDTEIVSSRDGDEYCILQEMLIDGQEVSLAEMSKVRTEVERIVRRNQELYKNTGHSLDLFGSAGFMTGLLALMMPGVTPTLSNLMMTRSGQEYTVRLVDVELLRLRVKDQTWTSVSQWLRAWVSFYLTNFLLRVVFKVSQ